ncbi:MAG: hypothetical protein MUF49_26610 [Oculatellaceae cyanobacterium Prado106]|jgi:hypothetical protein|nr:hypothetical protein [Oculatellaceae cyanobacterium Prado106]
MLKRKPLALILFALAGAGYFDVFSQISAEPFLKGYLAVVPIQVGVLLYFFWTGRLTPSSKKAHD